MTLREYFSSGFVHIVFGFGERLPVVVLFGLVRVDGFGGEQGSLREDARADVESVAVDDALQVGLAVEAAPAQRLERVSPSFPSTRKLTNRRQYSNLRLTKRPLRGASLSQPENHQTSTTYFTHPYFSS